MRRIAAVLGVLLLLVGIKLYHASAVSDVGAPAPAIDAVAENGERCEKIFTDEGIKSENPSIIRVR